MGRLNLAKVISQKVTSLSAHNDIMAQHTATLLNIFYHIRQGAARIAKMILWMHLVPHFGGREVVGVSDGTIRKSDGCFL